MAFVRWAAWGLRSLADSGAAPRIEGHRPSVAARINDLLARKAESVLDIFGGSKEYPNVLDLLDWTNREFKNAPQGPVSFGLNTAALPPQAIHVSYNGRPLERAEDLAALAASLERYWNDHGGAEVSGREAGPPSPPPASPDVSVEIRWPWVWEHLVGREAEMKELDRAWASGTARVMTVVAWGGVGKSALVKYWADRMCADGYRGATRVFGWTFHSQGTRDQKPATAADFINTALQWFGDPDPSVGSEYERGARLARLVLQRRTLLLLDGLEPLQHPPVSGAIGGTLRPDAKAVKALLTTLAAAGVTGTSMCVVTTRYAVTDLNGSVNTTRALHLTHLTAEAGSELLRKTLPHASGAYLTRTATLFGGHALSLFLLGAYVLQAWGGDLGKCLKLEEGQWGSVLPQKQEVDWRAADESQGLPAEGVMASYARWFGEGPELAALRVMGLFDRPAQAAEIAAVLQGDPLRGLTSLLGQSADGRWGMAARCLRDARLLAEQDPAAPTTFDTHPLVREYFARRFRETHPETWREAHRRLYLHHQALGQAHEAAYGRPRRLEDLLPWYTAVPHGCCAGLHPEVVEEVYRRQILRGREFFSTSVLGAIGADFAALYNFFDRAFDEPNPNLSPEQATFVLQQTGYCLRALGRLPEAAGCFERALTRRVEAQEWRAASTVAGLISQTYLSAGDLVRAIDYGARAVEAADRSEDPLARLKKRTALAYMKHQAGRREEAGEDFRLATVLQHELVTEGIARTDQYPVTALLCLFHESDWLIARDMHGAAEAAAQLAQAASRYPEVMEANKNTAALVWLVRGRAALHWRPAAARPDRATRSLFDQAVEAGRESGREDVLPLVLLGRAECRRRAGDVAGAWDDIREARAVAELCGTQLYRADSLLAAARLWLDETRVDEGERIRRATEEFRMAERLIGEMCYFRRDGELAELRTRLTLPQSPR